MTWDTLQPDPHTRIEDLLADPARARDFSIDLDGLFFDYSKTLLTSHARSSLIDMAITRGVPDKRDAMFAGAKINETEGRAVLHIALRAGEGAKISVDGHDVMPQIRDIRDRTARFAEAIRNGDLKGAGGPYTDVVNIGIGGSHLGPEMGVKALAPYGDGPRCHFVSNVDGADIADCLKHLDPTRTLVIVASKTFTTIETMTNAATARNWLSTAIPDPASQMAAVSSALDKTAEWGIPPDRVFGFEDWVGGRYSIWGPIGLPLLLAIGPEDFAAFLAGAEAMDTHFRTAPLEENMPVLLALVGLWHHQVCGHPTRAVLPYDQRLSRLPAYFQQLEMESNGKRVTLDGQDLDGPSGPVVWGEPGTNGQHAFYQLLHQGTQIVPCEFMVAARGHEAELDHHHLMLLANCLAQSEALMRGRDHENPHRTFPGNRPSTTLIYDRLSPFRLGQILALYEHRVFVEGAMLGLNSFDQWGVELGKELAKSMEP
ncbi:MAG: glucose-6-phosphate isomerase, partial [Pseudomonadota bacterium]